MALFADSNTLYQNIKAALPGWSFAENPSISDAVLGTIPSGKFSLWTTPSGEQLVVVLRQTSLTGSDRNKPQIRVFTDNIQFAYRYAKSTTYATFSLLTALHRQLILSCPLGQTLQNILFP